MLKIASNKVVSLGLRVQGLHRRCYGCVCYGGSNFRILPAVWGEFSVASYAWILCSMAEMKWSKIRLSVGGVLTEDLTFKLRI